MSGKRFFESEKSYLTSKIVFAVNLH